MAENAAKFYLNVKSQGQNFIQCSWSPKIGNPPPKCLQELLRTKFYRQTNWWTNGQSVSSLNGNTLINHVDLRNLPIQFKILCYFFYHMKITFNISYSIRSSHSRHCRSSKIRITWCIAVNRNCEHNQQQLFKHLSTLITKSLQRGWTWYNVVYNISLDCFSRLNITIGNQNWYVWYWMLYV